MTCSTFRAIRQAARSYRPVPGVPLLPSCSDGGLLFEPDGRGGGKLYAPRFEVEGREVTAHTASQRRMRGVEVKRGKLVARVRRWP